MTHDEWIKLTLDEQRTKVAIYDGFTNIVYRYENTFHADGYAEYIDLIYGMRYGISCVVPDYLNDLNAMHEAEKILKPEQVGRWMHHLCEACRVGQTHTCRATAAQRAEAFVLTMDKGE